MDRNTSLCGKSKGNPFAVVDTFDDPLCKLNLKETSEFVKSFPVAVNDNSISAQRRGVNSVIQKRIEAPPTPGRPVFSFSVGNFSRKNVPSKWDDAEKWLNSTSCHGSPAHPIKPVPIPIPESSKNQKQVDNFKQQMVVFSEKSRVTEEKVSKVISSFQSSLSLDHHNSASAFNGVSVSTDVFLKDKFADEVQSVLPNFKYSEPSREGFLFRNTNGETMKDVATEVIHEVQHRDVGTEMTPLGSSTVSRCHTPFTSSSPARHNTPANRSGPLALGHSNSINSTVDISQLQECHLAKLQLGTQYDSVPSNWSSREEEEEEISKSLRHFETGSVCQKSASDSRAAAWEEEEKTKCCLRYQREEAKIQAWVNLQSAKAEAQSKKLEVKIQKMRSNLEEKLMKRMVVVHRRAEEWRAAARQQHAEQIQKAGAQAQKIINRHNTHISVHSSCGLHYISLVKRGQWHCQFETWGVVATRRECTIGIGWSSFLCDFPNFCLAVGLACPATVSRSNQQQNMFLTRTEYDRGVNTFSPEGRLFQVEYAIEAIKLGSTAIGLKTKEGVVLAVEKRITSPLLEPSSVEKIMEIDEHIGCAMSGLIADARTLVEHARVETQNHRFSYGEPMTVESTTQALCDLALRFGEGDEESMSRPFGVSLLIAGSDENGPSLYYTDPSGTFWQCNAKAIGSGSEGADSSLQEQYNKVSLSLSLSLPRPECVCVDLTLQEAETIALSILKQVMEEKVTPNNVDIARVAPTYHLYTPSEVEAVINRL
ncbi:Remorin C domain-containing protein [Citrus sinensis]|nr:Remorin C domain-containing protein [Citrus sinensis]